MLEALTPLSGLLGHDALAIMPRPFHTYLSPVLAAVAVMVPLAWPAPAALAVILPRIGLAAAMESAVRHGWRPVRVRRLLGLPCLVLARGAGADRPPGLLMLPLPLGATCGIAALPPPQRLRS